MSGLSPSCSFTPTNCKFTLTYIPTLLVMQPLSKERATYEILLLHLQALLTVRPGSQWMPNTDLTALDPQACKGFPDKGKTKSLVAAYEIAGEQHDLAYFKEMLVDHQRAMQEDAELRAQREAKKQKKGKRKSTDATEDGEDLDMEDAEEMKAGDDGGDPKPKSKKRKKSLDSDGETEKVRSLH